MEGTGQAKEDLQVTGELDLLSDAISDINTKVDALEEKLHKVMIDPQITAKEAKQDEPTLCDIAKQIRDARHGARKVHHVLEYILVNLQL